MLKNIFKSIMKTVVLVSISFPFMLFAQTPTNAQLAQFKQLPKAQQEMLAKQYGVDLNAMSSLINGGGSENSLDQQEIQKPRKTIKSSNEGINGQEEELKLDEGELKPYGYDVLAGSPESFIVSDNIPVPNDYLIGPGDEIKIEIYGKENNQFTVAVTREGTVNLPSLGPVNASGLTFSAFRTTVIKLIKNKVIGVDVIVSMGTMRMMQVYIVGESNKPGAYNVPGITTISQALIASGGVKNTGSLRNIQLKRKGKLVKTLDLYEFLLNGNTQNDIRIESGDTLFIPPVDKRVSIEGAIHRPAVYEFIQPIKLIELIDTAGGTDITAYLSKISVQRITNQGILIETVDLTTQRGKNFPIKNGDKIKLAKFKDSTESGISIRGTVARQGGYEYNEGMKVSDLLTSVSIDLTPSTDLEYALIVREINANHDIDVLQFNLGKAIKSPQSADNIELKDRDQIFVFSNSLDVSFWLGIKDKTVEQLENETKSQITATVNQQNNLFDNVNSNEKVEDAETGAELVQKEVSDNNKLSTAQQLSDTMLFNIRAEQLKPILSRLKKQASLLSPMQIIDIYGEVKYPGTYPLSRNANIHSLLQASGGLLESAYVERAELSRTNYQKSDLFVTQKYIGLDTIDFENRLIPLQVKDRLNILTKPGWHDEFSIDIQGEVHFPGKYTFKRGIKISDIIKRAGGLTQFADENGAVFARAKLKKRELLQMKYLRKQLEQQIASMTLRKNSNSSSPAEAMSVVNELGNIKPMGRMVINLPKILQGDDAFDIRLADEDKLYILEKSEAISVIGEVQYTSSHTFVKNRSIEDYITLAGGMKTQADDDRVYVVRADGSVFVPKNSWFSRDEKVLRAGDTIIVPIDVDYMDGLSTIATATQIVYQLGVAWSAISRN